MTNVTDYIWNYYRDLHVRGAGVCLIFAIMIGLQTFRRFFIGFMLYIQVGVIWNPILVLQRTYWPWFSKRMPLSVSHFTTNPVVINNLRTWFQFRQHFGVKACPRLNLALSLWQRHRIYAFKDISVLVEFLQALRNCHRNLTYLGPAYSAIFKSATFSRVMTLTSNMHLLYQVKILF